MPRQLDINPGFQKAFDTIENTSRPLFITGKAGAGKSTLMKCLFGIYNKDSGCFEYKSGVVSNTNLLLGDEINRTSSKTQSALLEAADFPPSP